MHKVKFTTKRNFHRIAQKNCNDLMHVVRNNYLETSATVAASENSLSEGKSELLHTSVLSNIHINSKANTCTPSIPYESCENSDLCSENYFSFENDDKTNIEGNQAFTFKDKLAMWAIEHKTCHTALNDLLNLLQDVPYNLSLPKDARTLLCTQRQLNIYHMPPGNFFYFGLQSQIEKRLRFFNLSNINSTLEVAVNIDRLPLAKSSSSQLYPILCRIKNIVGTFSTEVFPVGIYHGYDKPGDSNTLLRHFVDEFKLLSTNGFFFENIDFKLKLTMLLCDASAKSFVFCTKGHAGYYSCSKCHEEGDYINIQGLFPKCHIL